MKYTILSLASAAALFASCIRNDIPYPTVELNIERIEGEGFTQKAVDAAQGVVTLSLDEQTDIRNVRIDRAELSCTPHNTSLTKEELTAQIRTSRPLTGTFDLRSPLYVTLSLYQDFDWSIRAEQTIERHFSVAGQVGSTEFDLENRTATAFVAKNADRSEVTVTALKLGPAEITDYAPTAEELSTMDFSAPAGGDPSLGTPHFVDVTCHGRTERWILYVLPTDKSVKLEAADAWSRVVWLRGSGIEGLTMGFRYRTGETEEWQEVPDVTSEGGTFSARFPATENTAYQFMAYCGDELTDPVSVTTDPVEQLPNTGFEEWCTIKSSNNYDVVYPYAAEGVPYWGTGNVGASVAKETLTDKGEPRTGSSGSFSARLQSKFANIAGIGKFAAGNLFTGRYVRNAGTDGIITFGRPFTLRPTAMRIWVKYKRGTIDKVKGVPVGEQIQKGDPDNGSIYIALGTWTAAEYGQDSEGKQIGTDDSPICIDTRDASTLFDSKGKDVVGYGELILGDTPNWEDITEWKEMVIPIVYPDTGIRPTHVLIVCSASRWGDYFTGSTKSELWVDDFELIFE